ncbi:MAG: SPOR domain-containing protein [Bacteroidota bacterium]
MKRPLSLLLIVSSLLFLADCSATESVQEPEEEVSESPSPSDEETDERVSSEEEEQIAGQLQGHRSELRDRFVGLSHHMPEFYERVEEQQSDSTQGFRVQILSTRDVALADTTRKEYEEWIEEMNLDAQPHSYIDYRQPTYRVRVGDFHDRDRAILFSQVVKRQFPAAWVVYSQVEPDRVPADSVRFEPVRD